MSDMTEAQKQNLAAAELLQAKILGLFLHIEETVKEIPGAELEVGVIPGPHQFQGGVWVADPRPAYSSRPLQNRMTLAPMNWKSFRVKQAGFGPAFSVSVEVSNTHSVYVVVDYDRTARLSKFPSITSAIQGAFQNLQYKNKADSQKKSLEEQCMEALTTQLPPAAVDQSDNSRWGSLSVKSGIVSGYAYLTTGPRIEFTFTPGTGLRITEVSQEPRATALKEARDAAMVQARKDFSDAAFALLNS